MLRNIINEFFFTIAGVFMLLCPLTGSSLGNWAVFLGGVAFLMALVATYTVGFHFDRQFKKVFLKDKVLGEKLPLSFVSADWYLSLRLVRAGMYARNIVLPSGTKKTGYRSHGFMGITLEKMRA